MHRVESSVMFGAFPAKILAIESDRSTTRPSRAE
jgi:hypothetical protein